MGGQTRQGHLDVKPNSNSPLLFAARLNLLVKTGRKLLLVVESGETQSDQEDDETHGDDDGDDGGGLALVILLLGVRINLTAVLVLGIRVGRHLLAISVRIFLILVVVIIINRGLGGSWGGCRDSGGCRGGGGRCCRCWNINYYLERFLNKKKSI